MAQTCILCTPKVIKMFKQLVSLLLLASTCYSADTDGTYFITSFNHFRVDNPNDYAIDLTLVPIGTEKLRASVKSWSIKDRAVKYVTIDVLPNQINSVGLLFSDVVNDQVQYTGRVATVPEPRVIINSTAPIKVIAKLFNTKTGSGDMWMVPDFKMFASEYVIRLPVSKDGSAQMISMMTDETTDMKLNVKEFIGGKLQQESDFISYAQYGTTQTSIISAGDDLERTFLVTAPRPIYVVAVSTCIDIFANSGDQTMHTYDKCDYGAFHPLHIINFNCGTTFHGVSDLRMTNTYFSKSIFVSPSKIQCGSQNQTPILKFNDAFPNGQQLNITTDASTRYDINSVIYTEFGIEADHVITPWARLGGMRKPGNDKNSLSSAFLTGVPETTQYITGLTSFITHTSTGYLEVYGDKNVNAKEFLIDGQSVDKSLINQIPIKFFSGNYSSFIINIPKGGLHTFTSRGNYIAYAVGTFVDGQDYGFGYITGYNWSNLIW
uniref:IgGFc_binding domain-containing protein n=1 Tax=Rhabditophanes sp. KR3021 TaxID=114890 RepID=A0AC35TY47_9BILA